MQEIELLFKARIEADYSKQYTSDMLGVSLNTLKAWEQGKSEPRLSDLKRWAAFFGYKLKLTR